MTGARPTFERECFLIAPIGDERSEIRKRSDLVHEYIVSPAAEELGQVAVRADQLATPGRITRQIIDHLLHVFYELAVRHTARMPVALIVLRGSSFVEVDPSPLLGRPRIPQLVPYDYEQSASDFLETIWRIWARRRGHDYDWRQLSETGIEPGMRLEALRSERRAKQHP
jgi:hypothetical protein